MTMTFKKRLSITLLALWAVAFTQGALARQSVVTATFNPGRLPSKDAFVDTSQAGFICEGAPYKCAGRKSFSARLLTTSAPLSINNPDPRQGLFFKIPDGWKDITVLHNKTGESRVVQLRFVSIAARLGTRPDITVITGINDIPQAHIALWANGGPGVAPPGCTGVYGQALSEFDYELVWTPQGNAPCSKQNLFNIVRAAPATEFTYEIRTPSPLDMTTGTWDGLLPLRVGPGLDIDLGDNITSTDPVFDIRIELNVQHYMSIVFPPGADRLALEPENGWVAWVNRGSRPERIAREQPFQLSSSVFMRMHIECQYSIGEDCAIQNPAGHEVPVVTRMTLPGDMRLLTGGPVDKARLSNLYALKTAPAQFVDDQTGKLHFEVARNDVDAMLAHQDTTYSGNVTVVWDSYLIP